MSKEQEIQPAEPTSLQKIFGEKPPITESDYKDYYDYKLDQVNGGGPVFVARKPDDSGNFVVDYFIDSVSIGYISTDLNSNSDVFIGNDQINNQPITLDEAIEHIEVYVEMFNSSTLA